jgi:hypothetical protein
MRVVLSTHGSRADVEAMVGLAVTGATPPVATGVMPTGGWR